jgi:hypothetical protein
MEGRWKGKGQNGSSGLEMEVSPARSPLPILSLARLRLARFVLRTQTLSILGFGLAEQKASPRGLRVWICSV